MNTKGKRRSVIMVIAIVGASIGLLGFTQGRSELRLRQLTTPRPHLSVRPRTTSQKAAWFQSNRRLADLWLAHYQRDVASELLPLLKNPDSDIKRRTARALGRLESGKALQPLTTLEKSLKFQKVASPTYGSSPTDQLNEASLEQQMGEMFYPTLPLAVARIHARNLHGQAKVEAVAKGVGLSFTQIVRLSQLVNAPQSHAQGTAGHEIVQEIVDVLYHMGKQGENIKPLAQRLTLTVAQQVLMQAASLPLEQEINLILEYALHIKVEKNDDSYLTGSHLVGLGPYATKLLIQRLDDMQQKPEHYLYAVPYGRGYVFLFRAAALTGDRRVLPLMKQFEKDFQKNLDPWVWTFAQQSRQLIEKHLNTPIFPA